MTEFKPIFANPEIGIVVKFREYSVVQSSQSMIDFYQNCLLYNELQFETN